MDPSNLKRKSKFLSLVLRHKPETIGLTLDENGWCYVADLLEKIGWSKEILEEIVRTNNKKRFEIKNEKIRASQGHSIEVDLGYKPIKPPSLLFHGTSIVNFPGIVSKGITKQSRHHVHLSADYDTAIAVGERHGTPFVFLIDSKKMHEDGVEFFESENGVWLTDYIAPKYLMTAHYLVEEKPLYNIDNDDWRMRKLKWEIGKKLIED